MENENKFFLFSDLELRIIREFFVNLVTFVGPILMCCLFKSNYTLTKLISFPSFFFAISFFFFANTQLLVLTSPFLYYFFVLLLLRNLFILSSSPFSSHKYSFFFTNLTQKGRERANLSQWVCEFRLVFCSVVAVDWVFKGQDWWVGGCDRWVEVWDWWLLGLTRWWFLGLAQWWLPCFVPWLFTRVTILTKVNVQAPPLRVF